MGNDRGDRAGKGTVYGRFAEVARRRGDAPAMTGGGRTWSYAELLDETERIAAGLEGVGLQPGDRLAIFSANHPAIPLLWLGAARSGVVASAINFMLRPRELAWILGNLEPSALVVGVEQLDVARKALAEAGLDVPLWVAADEPVDGLAPYRALLADEPYEGPLPAPDDVVEVTYTSGTTRNPKGAVFTNAAHVYSLDAWIEGFEMGDDDVVYTVMPLFHAAGIRNSVLVTVMSGGHVVVGERFSASNFWREVCDLGVTLFIFVETILVLLDRQEPNEFERAHQVRVAVGPAQPELLRRAEERFGLVTAQGYGMTEISMCNMTPLDMSREELHAMRSAHPDATYIGVPLGDQTEVRLVDDEGNDVAEGETGEFWMQAPGMLQEYLRDPEATAEFLHGGWIHTGDLGIQGPGQHRYFVDRKKDMIRRGGENFAPREVEDVLQAHAKVAEVTVFPVPDPIRMQEAKAIVVPAEGVDPGSGLARELWEWCDEHLATFKVPRFVEFRSSIPRNATGRALKNDLRKEPIAGEGETYDRAAEGAIVPADGPASGS